MKKLFLYFAGLLLISACGKDGAPGAAGPQGPSGNANVHSSTFVVTATQWQTTGTSGTDYEKYVDLSDPYITQDILDNGAVLVYWITSSGINVQLPYQNVYPAGSTPFIYQPSATVGTATVEAYYSDWTSFNFNASSQIKFKVVTIDGSLRVTHPEINWKDPQSIVKGLNLQL
ncbi:MAG: hypothetical protein ACK44N_04205 [Bacteroidota bacterium]|jgi:hypothetical protein